jgi:hypothetical protein
MPFHYQLNYLQNNENLGQISFFIGEIFEEIKVVRFFLDKLYIGRPKIFVKNINEFGRSNVQFE